MIDYKESAKLNGCTVSELKDRFSRFPKSAKKVVAICENCGKIRILKKQNYRDLCFICNNKDKTYIENRRKSHLGGERLSNEELYRLYIIEKKDTMYISEITGVSTPTVSNWLREADIEIRSRVERNLGVMNPMYGKVGQRGSKHWNWQGGISENKYCYLFNERFKESIRNLYDRRCFLCGKTEEENGRRHDVHHVNYDKDCLCNGGCEFVPLCISCHVKTNCNRKYWEDIIMCYLYPNMIVMIDI